ncbi:enoyl-CoA hydratase [Streptomyces nitrosporeus]|uniref:Enoyl-CoA hydratase n=1 Tax=Streptomyces nitrosporeus TaxID=28894 RepID=A0A5J6F490_9ACTN|nr:MaoC/PaaZ C-terminal domain-containing protein [Streptomyces nitrosporeus]QEU71099.1 enoyl-CoA hydratase [Streptomyces nitrosporeus]GGZ15071.1 3-alpha,7-alpha,12-alpha-trihydroxy-5-beta-cholest-24-enoyl-CoA hydratase [Streptomyces nitrosporeus]
MTASPWQGRALGTRTVSWTERDAILYALAVGAPADRLDLVYEERLRVLPTFALTLAQWAPDALGATGAFDVTTAVHGSQRLVVKRPLEPSGEMATTARVAAVWDKGSAAVFDVEVSSDHFTATWSVFAPGSGGFGGERGPSAPRRPDRPAGHTLTVATHARQAAFYRLLGDRHAMHIDPAAAAAAGMDRPFLHGLCTLAASLLPLADALGVHPAGLVELDARFAAPVYPGDRLALTGWAGDGTPDGRTACFEAAAGDGRAVLTGGRARFREPAEPPTPEAPDAFADRTENPDA